MPDTERTRQWLEMLRRSDAVLVQLVALAVLAVVGWELLRRMREPWRSRLRLLYLAAALGTLFTSLSGQVSTWLLVVMAAVLGAGAMTARALWAWGLRRHQAGPMQAKGE